MNDTLITAMISSLSTLILGSGGLYAWFKLGPERKKLTEESKKLTVEVAGEAVIIQRGVLEDIYKAYERISDELTEMRMESAGCEEKLKIHVTSIQELQVLQSYFKTELKRQSKIADIARRKSHIATHAIGGFVLLVDDILNEFRERDIPIKDEHRPHSLQKSFQEEMEKLEELEAQAVEEATKE